MESITVVILAICIFLSFYLTYLSFQTLDDTLKKQLVTLAAFSIITGVVMITCLTISLGIKKAFPKVESKPRNGREPSEHER